MRYSAIVFDLDGTLLNTLHDLTGCVNYAMRVHGMPERTLDEVRMFVGRGIRYMLSCAVPGGEDNPHFEEVMTTFMPYYEEHCADLTAPYEGIGELLDLLSERGVKMCVVTNKVQKAAEELVAEMFPKIPFVIGDSPAVRKKPAPDGVWLALEKMGVKKEDAAYVGDSDVDYATAKNAALPCLSVLWGFRTRDQLEAEGADTFFYTPEELGRYILGE